MEKIQRERTDFIMVLLLVLLCGVGISLLFSGSYPFSARSYHDPLALVKKQLIFLAAGAALAFLLSMTPLELLRRGMPLILAGTLLVSLLPFVPGLGVTVLGSRRWIGAFGVTFQPSELVKLTLVLYLASYFANEKRGRSLNELIPPFIIIALFAAIIYIQNDYSTAVFVLVFGLGMFFICGVRGLHVILISLVTLPVSFVLLFTRAHRVRRLLAFINLASDPAGGGYQIVNSQSALVSGGLWGKGLGRSAAKLGPLPMSHSDFIFSVIGEETGFLGVLFVLALFALLAWRGFLLAFRSEDPFRSSLAFGITTTITLQALLNMAVAAGLVPTTGITLPFFSAGGSSLAVTLAMCGLLLNISRGSGSAPAAAGRSGGSPEWRQDNV
jgi:cell division protein FtsW